ncbi:MAG: hypothetical protein IMF16_02455 [Proteobacteria bacterium]|nr:hypothetical protein [Pseudomonadota bacterium]
MSAMTAVTTFLIALVGGSLSAWVTLALERRHETRRRVEALRAEICVLLTDAAFWHSSIAAADFWGKQARAKYRDAYDRKRDLIREKLQQVPNWPECASILHTLFALSYEKEMRRAEVLQGLGDRLLAESNPPYATAMRDIHSDNMKLFYSNPDEFLRRREKLTAL